VDNDTDDTSTNETVALKDREADDELAQDEGAVAEEDAEQAGDADESAAWEAPHDESPRGGISPVLSGAGAVVAAGLGLASITGTWLGTVLSDRSELVGQIYTQANSSKMTSANQISEVYGKPWHTLAGVNGLFAVVAVVLAGVMLVLTGTQPATAERPVWVRALSWGAVVLGAIGLLIAIAMYFDVFAGLPAVPATSGGATG